jgi:hypothetical protein
MGAFLRLYQRKSEKRTEPNDRGYDRAIARYIRRLINCPLKNRYPKPTKACSPKSHGTEVVSASDRSTVFGADSNISLRAESSDTAHLVISGIIGWNCTGRSSSFGPFSTVSAFFANSVICPISAPTRAVAVLPLKIKTSAEKPGQLPRSYAIVCVRSAVIFPAAS